MAEGKCAWCGCTFEKSHGNQKYCSDDCLKYATQEQTRNRFHKWYHKHKHDMGDTKRYGLGTGTLHGHCESDFSVEASVVSKEMSRLRIK